MLTIGYQISEAVSIHNPADAGATPRRAVELLELVGSRTPSGASSSTRTSSRAACDNGDDRDGDRQRPELLVADEPTTALDVTIQAQILECSDRLRETPRRRPRHARSRPHRRARDRVVVMYAGRVVELGDVYTIFNSPGHPYTIGLMNSLARLDTDQERLEPIPGQPPSMRSTARLRLPPALRALTGARCAGRTFRSCGYSARAEQHRSACHFSDELAARHVVGVGAEPS